MNTKNRDNFAKIRFGCRTVLVIIFLIAGILLLGLSCKMIANNKAEMDQNFESYYDVVEAEVYGFQKISDALFANGDVKNFAKGLSGEYKPYMIIPVAKMIRLFETFFTGGECSIVLTNLENNTCASGEGSAEFDSVCAELMLSDSTINAIKNNHATNKFYVYSKENKLISFVFCNAQDYDVKLYCIITADVSAILPHENFAIVNDNDRFWGKAGVTGNVNFGKTYIKESVIIPGLAYKYNAKYNNIFSLMFLIICSIFCFVSAFFNRRICDRLLNVLYIPVIKWSQTSAENEILKGEESWEASAKRLIGDSELLRNTIKESTSFRKKTYLRNLLYDIEDYHEKYLEEFDLKYLDGECRVILIDYSNKNDFSAVKERTSDKEFEKNLKKQVEKDIPGELISVNEGRYVYITSVCDKERLRKTLAGVLDLAAACRMDAFVAVGERVEGLKSVKSSFRNALDCLERKNMFSPHFIVFSSELTNELTSFYYPIDVEVQLIDNILIGNHEVVDEILSKVLAKNLYEISLTAEKMRELKIVMVGTINRAINRMNKEVSDIFGATSSVYLEIGASRNKEEFAKSVRSVFGMLCAYNESGGDSKQDKIARDIMNYIEANFGDSDLSLEKVAKIFYISQNHVSRVLKSKIGKSYKEYLNDVRINEAKRLLKNTPMTVLNVANSVGYTDIRAFNRLFKKYTNQTPNEYRMI